MRYFHDAHAATVEENAAGKQLDRRDYVDKRELWQAFEQADETGFPAVLLIDEIDKAPRDFPNDLLHEVDQMEFAVREVPDWKVTCQPKLRPLLFITSNDERRLPPAFLRRCVSHHIRLTEELLRSAVQSHSELYPDLSPEFFETAISCFLQIRRATYWLHD